MWRIVFTVLLLVMFALPALADDEMMQEIDDTFRSVNKHLYGVGDETQHPQPAKERATPPEETAPPPKSRRPVPDEDAPPVMVSDAGEDEHYIQLDDYFISDEPLGQHSWIWVGLAKMVTPPSAATKKEAEFFQVKDGNKVWIKNYWQTRRAQKVELKLGTVVVAFNDHRQDDIYSAPESKETARGGSWFMAKITDLSDLYKGYVTVSGNYKVSPNNLRVIK